MLRPLGTVLLILGILSVAYGAVEFSMTYVSSPDPAYAFRAFSIMGPLFGGMILVITGLLFRFRRRWIL